MWGKNQGFPVCDLGLTRFRASSYAPAESIWATVSTSHLDNGHGSSILDFKFVPLRLGSLLAARAIRLA